MQKLQGVINTIGIVDSITLVLHAKKDGKLDVASNPTLYPTTSPRVARQSNQTATSTAKSVNPHGSKADVEG